MSIVKTGRRSAVARSVALLVTVAATGGGLAVWKTASAQRAEAAAASGTEPVEVVTSAEVVAREHRATTTSIGTVLATRSVTLRNEISGTVRYVRLTPGDVVDAGTILVALDVSVEEAELAALQAQAELAETMLARVERMFERQAASAIELDNARAERDVALAQIARTRAVVERKTIRAPFRSRVGLADVHPGQFLDSGTFLTTLQGVDTSVNVDFAVPQAVAATLEPGETVDIELGDDVSAPVVGRVVAVDSKVDPLTRNATIRARIEGGGAALAPGSSVRVRVPTGEAQVAGAVPVSALRKGPEGDHVFALVPGDGGVVRAQRRAVRAGPVLGDEVLLLEGVVPGEQVAASGSFKLRDGVLVQVAASEPANAIAGR